MNPPVLVTRTEFARAEAVFRGASELGCEPVEPAEEALAAAVTSTGARAVIVGVTPYRGPLYEALGRPGGGLIARFGVGHDSIDKALARRHGIVVTNTPGVLDDSVAEHALWLTGCLARRIARLDARTRAGAFAGETGLELRGRTLGILGFGAIGRRVAAMAHFGFGLRVIACDRLPPDVWAAEEPRPAAEVLAEAGVERYTSDAGDLFRSSDIVSIHLPSNPATRHFVNADRLASMKPGSLLVNTARGAVLDEDALYDALSAGRPAGAALDVFEREPYEPVSPSRDLRRLENVVLTPHIGSNTVESNRRMGEACVANVRHYLAGRPDRLSRVDVAVGA